VFSTILVVGEPSSGAWALGGPFAVVPVRLSAALHVSPGGTSRGRSQYGNPKSSRGCRSRRGPCRMKEVNPHDPNGGVKRDLHRPATTVVGHHPCRIPKTPKPHQDLLIIELWTSLRSNQRAIFCRRRAF